MTTPWTIECPVHFRRQGPGARKALRAGPGPEPGPAGGRVPRVARLMALAWRLDCLVRSGQVASYAELAALGHVSRARISQVLALLQLAPDIQEQILFLPPVTRGRDPLALGQILPIAALLPWAAQRRRWRRLGPPAPTGAEAAAADRSEGEPRKAGASPGCGPARGPNLSRKGSNRTG